ncbi:radical SAM/SPASM domain-containing protein [Gimesia aquarii]|uniref:Radical SAM superfamily protein n=1 Tax=Gimesia aquarii TaxID=2527964 RepID=A0A517W341_9PLAN|nr:radical SAM/SPASM domain-containing protein [Gimesia aquarii]QDT99666.1 Radical SAM superfamily protein [Gimesia aquarii]
MLEIISPYEYSEQRAEYDMGVARMRHSQYMDYPRHVHLETLARCNASCNFCPYPNLNRKHTKMSDELIDKVLNELTELPPEMNFQISPFKVSEPFLDTRLFQTLRKINSLIPQAKITLTSNATPITEDKLEALQEIKNIGYLWISFNDHREEEYERVMALPYQRTRERLDMIHDAFTEGDVYFPVVLSRVGDGSRVDYEFGDWVSINYPLFKSSIFPRMEWMGQVEGLNVNPVPNMGCERWFELSITATGEVAHCCADGQADYPIGNANEQHVLEIYNSPEYRKLREATVSRLSVEPCNKCTFM